MRQTVIKVLKSKLFIIPLSAFLLYTLIGFVIAPLTIRWYVPKYLKENLHCQAGLAKVRINPFRLTVEAKGFSLNQEDGSPLVGFERLFVRLRGSSLFHLAAILRELSLDNPAVHVALEPDGELNLQKLAPKTSEPKKADSKPFPLILQNLNINKGSIYFVDRRQSKPAELHLEALDLKVKDLSTFKDQNGTYFLSASTQDGGTIDWQGQFSLIPLRSTGKLDFGGIRAETLWGFVRDNVNIEPPTGQLNFSTSYVFDSSTSPVQIAMDGIGLALSDLSLKLVGDHKPFLELKKAEISSTAFDLAKKDIQLGKFLVEGGAVDVRIGESGKINIEKIAHEKLKESKKEEQDSQKETPAAEGEQEAAPPGQAEAPFKLKADAVEIKDFAIAFDDESRPVPIRAGIASVALEFKADAEAGSKVSKILIKEISSNLKKIQLETPQSPEPLFATDTLEVEGGECNVSGRSVTFSHIALNNGHFDVSRNKDGRLNWQELAGSEGAGGESSESKSGGESGGKWHFLVESFEVDGFSSKLSDLTVLPDKPLYSMKNIKAKVTNIDGKSPMDFTAAFEVEQGGSANFQGKVDPSAPSVEAQLTVTSLPLTPLQPYLESFITLVLRSAEVSTQGTLHYGPPGGAANVAYDGGFSLNKLSLSQPDSSETYLGWDSLQIPKIKVTLQPNALEAPEIMLVKPVGEFIIEPDRTLSLSRIFKNQGGPEAVPPTAKSQSNQGQDEFRFRISQVKVDKGNMVFADMSLKPNFRARIHDLKGTVSGISSDKNAESKIQLEGGVDQYGFARINGILRLYEFKRSSDIDMVFKNVEMTTLSPYSGKFAGRDIKSGRLSANLKYKIENYKMNGNNEIIVDNLLLGQHVDSPGAVNLPLDLAVALLKDSNGRINIGLPVTGDLDDPQFSIWPLLWKALENLIVKTATAPFRAIGALFGGESGKTDVVEFDAGNAELLPPEKEKLKKLAEALQKRPELKLIVQGVYSPEADGMELKDRSIRRAVGARLGIVLKSGEEPGPLDFGDSKTQQALEDLYKERFGKSSMAELEEGIKKGTIKPRMPARQEEESKHKKRGFFTRMMGDLKLYKIIPGERSPKEAAAWAGELYVRLVEGEKISDETLLSLAEKRAESVVKELETGDQVPAGRLSIKKAEPQSGDAEPSVKLSLTAV